MTGISRHSLLHENHTQRGSLIPVSLMLTSETMASCHFSSSRAITIRWI
jgi:hypothetical protein